MSAIHGWQWPLMILCTLPLVYLVVAQRWRRAKARRHRRLRRLPPEYKLRARPRWWATVERESGGKIHL
jgi:hypothetical protein